MRCFVTSISPERPSASCRAWGVKTFPCGNDLLEICFSMQEPASILLTQNQASSTPAAYRRPSPPHVRLHVASLREGGGFCVAKDGRSPREPCFPHINGYKTKLHALSFSRLRRQLSLRLGHSSGLTVHRTVIQYLGAASLPPGGSLCQ